MKEECKDFTNEQSFNWQLKQVISFFFLLTALINKETILPLN